MVITLQNLKILLSLLLLFCPTISIFYQLNKWIFGGLVIKLNCFLEISKNYVSIIIIVISNITVSASHNAICFGYFMPMSHGVNKKSPTIASLHFPTNQVFTRFVCCFTRNTLWTFFYSALTDYCKKECIFKVKQNFFFQLIAGQFWFCCFVHVFLRALFLVLPSWSYK